MNEEERASQVSALFDGTLEASQSELVIRRIMKDPPSGRPGDAMP